MQRHGGGHRLRREPARRLRLAHPGDRAVHLPRRLRHGGCRPGQVRGPHPAAACPGDHGDARGAARGRRRRGAGAEPAGDVRDPEVGDPADVGGAPGGDLELGGVVGEEAVGLGVDEGVRGVGALAVHAAVQHGPARQAQEQGRLHGHVHHAHVRVHPPRRRVEGVEARPDLGPHRGPVQGRAGRLLVAGHEVRGQRDDGDVRGQQCGRPGVGGHDRHVERPGRRQAGGVPQVPRPVLVGVVEDPPAGRGHQRDSRSAASADGSGTSWGSNPYASSAAARSRASSAACSSRST